MVSTFSHIWPTRARPSAFPFSVIRDLYHFFLSLFCSRPSPSPLYYLSMPKRPWAPLSSFSSWACPQCQHLLFPPTLEDVSNCTCILCMFMLYFSPYCLIFLSSGCPALPFLWLYLSSSFGVRLHWSSTSFIYVLAVWDVHNYWYLCFLFLL